MNFWTVEMIIRRSHKTLLMLFELESPKNIELPLASLLGEHTVTTADVMIGIGSLRSSNPVTSLSVYTTSIEQLQLPTVPAEMLNRLCREHDHLADINFPQICDNKIGIFIGAEAFLATVPRHFTTGKTGTPYGVNTLLGWTLTGPVPQEYFQPNNKMKQQPQHHSFQPSQAR